MAWSPWTTIRRAWAALGEGDAETRAAFERESSALNLKSLRVVVPILVCIQLLVIVLLLRAPAPTPEHVAWVTGLLAIHAGLLIMAAFVAIAARVARSPLRGIWLGNVAAAGYVAGGALMSANVQRF